MNETTRAPMEYVTTRGGCEPITFSQAALEPSGPDGGLRVPQHIVRVGTRILEKWRELSYPDLAVEIMHPYCSEIPKEDLAKICHKTYTAQAFGHSRNGGDPANVTPLTWFRKDQLGIQELANGETYAFKDIGLQFLGNIFEYLLEKNGSFLNILGATSGDTGSAAIAGVRGKKRITITILHPHGRVSPVQEKQLTTVLDDNVHNIAIRGTFDDGQRVMKALFRDKHFVQQFHIGAVNSTNWVRILAQTVYYVWGYLRATDNGPKRINFSVPTGNFGDAFAGIVARMMGIPINKLILATNENDPVARFFNTGWYDPQNSREAIQTSSFSMDITVASNLERFMYYLLNKDGNRITKLFTGGLFNLSEDPVFGDIYPRFGIMSGSSTEKDRLEVIYRTYLLYDKFIDPHTADGMRVGRDHFDPCDAEAVMICLETAQWVKFGDTMRKALGFTPDLPDEIKQLMDLPARVHVMDPRDELIRQFIIDNCPSELLPPPS